MVVLGLGLRPWLVVGKGTWNITAMVTVAQGIMAEYKLDFCNSCGVLLLAEDMM